MLEVMAKSWILKVGAVSNVLVFCYCCRVMQTLGLCLCALHISLSSHFSLPILMWDMEFLSLLKLLKDHNKKTMYIIQIIKHYIYVV
jgi:hypothetical protein